jgi:CheY-like chemotaxis protein
VNSILALARLLAEAPLDDEARKQLCLIRRSAEDLEALVSDLLDLAKIEAGKTEIRPTELDVANLFSALRGMLRPLLVNRSLSLVFEEPEGLPMMYTDEGKLSQILRNFISNALKYTEAGEIRINAVLVPERGTILFSVSDTGIGIAAEDQERIFDEFSQIDNPLQQRQKGTGLGLPLTRKLAALLGGAVGVRSEPGLGSTFTAEIPIHFSGVPSTEPRRHRGRGAVDRPELPATAPMRILIIDDDETARYAIGSFASRSGTAIIEAENGTIGIARAQTEHPDIILLDLMMPGIGGHEVLQRLKGDPATAPIPVLVITSRFINDEERSQIQTRASAVINKADLSREVVIRAIDEALGR